MTGSSWPSSVGALRRPPAGVPMPDSGPVAGLPPSDVSHARALLVGLSAWAVSYGLVQFATPDTGVPGIWLPGAIVVGLMLRLRTDLWWWVLLGTALANVVGGLVAGFATALDTLIWTVANTVQMAAIAAVLRRWRIDLTRPHHVPVIAGVSAVVVAVVAFLGSVTLEWSSGVVAQDLWREWWGSDVLALVLVVPAALAATRSGLPRGARAAEAVGWLVAVLVAMTLVYTEVVTTPFGGWFWITVSTPWWCSTPGASGSSR